MHDTAAPWAETSSLLASSFYDFLNEDGMTFEEFESRSIACGHAVIVTGASSRPGSPVEGRPIMDPQTVIAISEVLLVVIGIIELVLARKK